ncbi:ABC transporter ATP-binding protein [Bradyrhizobium cenepequi]
MIRISNAGHCFRFEHWLFRGLSATFAPSQVVAILGPNGCGKTTLLRAICGTLELKEGRVDLDGHVGFVPQALLADQAYSAIDMVLLGRSRYLGSFNVPGRRDNERARECLDEVGLSAIAHQRYDRLSGGQRQLVLLARALASDCEILVLDEPASALDLANQGIVLRLLQHLARTRSLTILFTTHHPDHALGIADTTLLMLRDATHIAGATGTVLTESNLARMYGVPVRRVDVRSDGEIAAAIVPLHGLRHDAPQGTADR